MCLVKNANPKSKFVDTKTAPQNCKMNFVLNGWEQHPQVEHPYTSAVRVTGKLECLGLCYENGRVIADAE